LTAGEGEDPVKVEMAAYEKLTGSKSGFGAGRSCSRSSSRTRNINGPSYTAHTAASYMKVERAPVHDPELDFDNIDVNNNNTTVGHHVPAQILYKGHKMVPIEMVEQKEKEIKNMEASNRALSTKVRQNITGCN